MSILSKSIHAIKEGRFLQSSVRGFKSRLKRFVKLPIADRLYFLNQDKIAVKRFLESIDDIEEHHYGVGNYYLDDRINLSADSIIYSFGIGKEVSFDESISKKYGCQVFMYDPTPSSISFMEKMHSKNAHFRFFPFGLWTEQTVLRFYTPSTGGSSSALYKKGNDFFDAECYTFQQLLGINKHTHVDVFKADIEGAALPVLEQILSASIYPTQIVVEFEAPLGEDKEKLTIFLNRVGHLIEHLKDKGYLVYRLPRKVGLYSSLELLFARLNFTS